MCFGPGQPWQWSGTRQAKKTHCMERAYDSSASLLLLLLLEPLRGSFGGAAAGAGGGGGRSSTRSMPAVELPLIDATRDSKRLTKKPRGPVTSKTPTMGTLQRSVPGCQATW